MSASRCEDVAELLGAGVLSEEEIGLRSYGWEGKTPLWLYILRESSARHSGDRLAVGGRISGEVLYGVIARDPESYLAVDADWQPTLPPPGGVQAARSAHAGLSRGTFAFLGAGAQAGLPAATQRRTTSTCSCGQAVSHGIAPVATARRIASACALTSSCDQRSNDESIALRSPPERVA